MNQTALLYSLITVVLWGTAAILDKLMADRLPPVTIVLLRTGFIVLFILGYGGGVRQLPHLSAIPLRAYLLVAASAAMVAFSMLSYFQALRWGEASRVIAFTSAYPLLSIVIAVAFLHEPLTLRKVLGALVIVGGLWLLSEPLPDRPEPAAGKEESLGLERTLPATSFSAGRNPNGR